MKLRDIYIYPIKSLGGIRLEEAQVEEKGLQYDRRWMLVDKEGNFLTQRKHENMALFQVVLNDKGLRVFLKNDQESNILIPYDLCTGKKLYVQIWEDKVEAQVVDEVISSWFTQQLGIPCDLVVMPESTKRKLKPQYAVNEETVSFADGMPYLIIGQASLDDLNSRLQSPVPMNRFRPNFVFSGGEPFDEDRAGTIMIGASHFKITKPCARCVMVTIDQTSGEKGKEPLKTLASYRTVNKKVMFGQNMLLLSGSTVKVGDEVIMGSCQMD
ncbi:MOSC domain-containing protein [Anditalea andensis]|uniref:Oxidoreductase n=1 Tax=Anditalea andensis TaxID=1048983 RepID=A0A074L0E3_9BACT|nr:MOSC N-terminal beta barrel domain-containing protein [Anditalea andensis]KEO73343.1 oxidoreductase [Anditalea andensis]